MQLTKMSLYCYYFVLGHKATLMSFYSNRAIIDDHEDKLLNYLQQSNQH